MWEQIKRYFGGFGTTIRALPAFLRSIVGSRIGMAVAAAFLVAFGMQSVTAPERLPPIQLVPLWQLGLGPAPPTVALPPLPAFVPMDMQAKIAAQVKSQALAQRDTLVRRAQDVVVANPMLIRAVNYGGALLAAVSLVVATALRAQFLRRIQVVPAR